MNGAILHKTVDRRIFPDQRYKLRDPMFLHGFSAGSQFVHRFAMNHPKQACGVSAHSGGTWATDGYGKISASAATIPFARIEWYGRFRDEIAGKKFCHIAASGPGVGHNISRGAWGLARQCFQLATGLPGKSATEEVEIGVEWKNIDAWTASVNRSKTGADYRKPTLSRHRRHRNYRSCEGEVTECSHLEGSGC